MNIEDESHQILKAMKADYLEAVSSGDTVKVKELRQSMNDLVSIPTVDSTTYEDHRTRDEDNFYSGRSNE